jgi:hypothetical protein
VDKSLITEALAAVDYRQSAKAAWSSVSACFALWASLLLSLNGRHHAKRAILRETIRGRGFSGKGMGSQHGDGEGEVV